jgi:hypothetical protein
MLPARGPPPYPLERRAGLLYRARRSNRRKKCAPARIFALVTAPPQPRCHRR